MKKTTWILWVLLLCLALPSLAAQENAVVPLPTVAPLNEVRPATTPSPYSVENMAGYYQSEMGPFTVEVYVYQSPRLSEGEIERLKELQEKYAGGARPQESALNKTEDVRVGVYALPPEDYEGQQVYTLLPGREMIDDELLQLIDAFAQLGQVFSPDSLSFRNCARGGGLEVSRFWQEDERQRMEVLDDQFRRHGLRPETPFTPLPGDDGVGRVRLHEDDYAGLGEFGFYPFRQMKDEELLRLLAYRNEGTAVEPTQYAAHEQQTRKELKRLLNAPLSLKLTSEEMGRANQNSVHLDDIPVYRAHFTSADGQDNHFALLDIATNQVVFAWPHYSTAGLKYSDLHLNPYDQKWQDIARAYIEACRQDGVKIAAMEARGEAPIQGIGYGAQFAVTMEDNGYYELTVCYQTEKVEGGLMYLSSPPKMDTWESMYGGRGN